MKYNGKPRIFKFDNVKLLVMVLVVVGSFAEDYTDHSDMFRSWFIFVNSFAAPLYIFLNGLFQKPYTKGERPTLHRATYYMILGFALKILIFLLRRWNGEEIGLDMFGGATMEWYLFVIMMYSVTFWILRYVNKWVVLTASVVFGTLAGFLPLDDGFYFMRYFVFMPFYAAGYYLTPAKVRRFSHSTKVKLAGLAFTVAYFILCFRAREIIYPLRMLFTGRNRYAIVPIEGCTFYHRLLCYGISAVLIISVIACMPNRKAPLLTHMGRNTLGVYFWHYPLKLLLWHFGVFDLIQTAGDPMWKINVLLAAVAAALMLSFGVFSWPLRKLEHLINKIPTIPCVIMDAVILIAAAIANQLIV